MAARGRGLFSLYINIENFNDLLVRNHWTDFSITLQECSFVTLYQDCSSRHDSSKNMAARGRGLISLYIYVENFKNLLVRNHWTDFIITWQKCFLVDPLPRLFKLSWFVKKPGRQGAGLIFPIYIYIENFKNLLVRNQYHHWTDFIITWQEWFFGDPLPRLFKPSWFVKKHGC